MMKNYILKKLFKWFDLKYFGIKFETELPPEFIITKHGSDRLWERFEIPEPMMKERILDVWYMGEDAPSDFNKIPAKLPERINRKKCVYKYFDGGVYVFFIHHNKHLGVAQKHFITVYEWYK